MSPDDVAVQVRERSGIDVQAVTLVRASSGEPSMPAVWAAMTELGHFWVVENGQASELFRAVARKTAPTDYSACHSAVEAARRFLELHPPARPAKPANQPSSARADAADAMTGVISTPAVEPGEAVASTSPLTCQACGAVLSSRSRSGRARANGPGRTLCARCRHAEHERLRYQQDPAYRARRLAYSAARYRRTQQATSPDA